MLSYIGLFSSMISEVHVNKHPALLFFSVEILNSSPAKGISKKVTTFILCFLNTMKRDETEKDKETEARKRRGKRMALREQYLENTWSATATLP